MNKYLLLTLTVVVSLSSTSCALFKPSLKANAFCSSSAFVEKGAIKPVAPATTSDKEFHQIAAENVKRQHTAVTAYTNLRECWDYFTK